MYGALANPTDSTDQQEHGKKRAVIYARVSTMAQARTNEGDGYSLEAQLGAGYHKATSMGAEVVDVYVDKGRTAKTIDRKQFTQMIERIQTLRDVDLVICHKLDRWARNRRDDANMAYELEQSGAALVSVSENIDGTPGGRLLHGILASINEFYSANLSGEILKGTVQKAKDGGTPHRVRLGYLNVRKQLGDGGEVRTVEVDPDRAPLIQYAFEQFATGELSVRDVLADVTAKGLRTRPTPKQPSKPLSVSRMADLLHSDYYCGIVRYRSVAYQGTHEPLIPQELYERVQEVFRLHDKAGERRKTHHHYLKGTVFCGRCGSRLVITKANGNGGVYFYFFCGGRQRGNGCTQPYVLVDEVEQAVIDHYELIELSPERQQKLQANLAAELKRSRRNAERSTKQLKATLATLDDERMKLLQAHYAGAIPLDLLKREQDRITREQADAERRLADVTAHHGDTEAVLADAIRLAGNCQQLYKSLSLEERRLMNQAFFKKLLLDADEVRDYEWTEPFAALWAHDLAEEVRQHTASEVQESAEQKEPWSQCDQGSSKNILVGVTGLEPVTSAV